MLPLPLPLSDLSISEDVLPSSGSLGESGFGRYGDAVEGE